MVTFFALCLLAWSWQVQGSKLPFESYVSLFDFHHKFICEREVTTSEALDCHVYASGVETVEVTISYPGFPYANYLFQEGDTMLSGVPNLKSNAHRARSCGHRGSWLWGPFAFDEGYLKTINYIIQKPRVTVDFMEFICTEGYVSDYTFGFCSNGTLAERKIHGRITLNKINKPVKSYTLSKPWLLKRGYLILVSNAEKFQCVRFDSISPSLPGMFSIAMELIIRIPQPYKLPLFVPPSGQDYLTAIFEPRVKNLRGPSKRVDAYFAFINSNETENSTNSQEILLGNIAVTEQKRNKWSTGCGRRYDTFSTQSTLKISAVRKKGFVYAYKCFIENLDNRMLAYHETFQSKHDFELIIKAPIKAGRYRVELIAYGFGVSHPRHRLFRVLSKNEWLNSCQQYPGALVTGAWPALNLHPQKLSFDMYRIHGGAIYVEWQRQKVCIFPLSFNDTTYDCPLDKEVIRFTYAYLNNKTVVVDQLEDDTVCIHSKYLQIGTKNKLTMYADDTCIAGREDLTIYVPELQNSARPNITIVSPWLTRENRTVGTHYHVILSGSCSLLKCLLQWDITYVYHDGKVHYLSNEDYLNHTEGRNSSTFIIFPELLEKLPNKTRLIVCLKQRQFLGDNYDDDPTCMQLLIWPSKSCNACDDNAVPVIDATEKVCIFCTCPVGHGSFEFYVNLEAGDKVLNISDAPKFCGNIPPSKGLQKLCIRSLPDSQIYVDKCSIPFKYEPATVGDIEMSLKGILSGENGILEEAAESGNFNLIVRSIQEVSSKVQIFINDNANFSDSAREMVANVLGKAVTTLGSISEPFDLAKVLAVSSAIDTLSKNAREITYESIDTIADVLKNIMPQLPYVFNISSRDGIFRLCGRFLNTTFYLLDGMNYQVMNPTPFLKNLPIEDLHSNTDIDSKIEDSEMGLVAAQLRLKQSNSAKAMVTVLEQINNRMAHIFQVILVSDGQPFKTHSSESSSNCFCRVSVSSSGSRAPPCSIGSDTSGRGIVSYSVGYDIVVQSKTSKENIYSFVDDERNSPKSNIVSLTLFHNGTVLNTFELSPSFRLSLQANGDSLEEANESPADADSEERLPDAIEAVDGTAIYQPLVMHLFRIEELDKIFALHFHPQDFTSCPQYLFVARFIIPPSLTKPDDYGPFLWAMVPPSTFECGTNKSDEKLLTLYATYIDQSVLSVLKADTAERTKTLMLTNAELHTLYVGYRQLNEEELNRYDQDHPPPVPYPFMDQINVTTTLAASMPSCLHFSPGTADGWDRSGCKVVPSPFPDKIVCECSHLTNSTEIVEHDHTLN